MAFHCIKIDNKNPIAMKTKREIVKNWFPEYTVNLPDDYTQTPEI